MTVVALMAAGAHVLAITTPALAEQARQSRAAEAAEERSSVPGPTIAANDGLPVPALAGGIVLAFTVGLGAGHVHRRRRRSVPRPSRAPTAPSPPRPVEQSEQSEPPAFARPVPAAVPAPPAARPAEPRAVWPTSGPTRPPPLPPLPPGRAPMSSEEGAPGPRAPLYRAPEVPWPHDPGPARREPVTGPLGRAPEALRPADPDAPTTGPPVARPGKFARVAPWPDEAQGLWTCEITWKAGYRRSRFRAIAGPPGEGKRREIGESPPLRWTFMSDPEPPTPEFVAPARALVHALEAAGWERIGPSGPWYAQRFLWRGSGEPAAVAVLDTAQAAGPPPA